MKINLSKNSPIIVWPDPFLSSLSLGILVLVLVGHGGKNGFIWGAGTILLIYSWLILLFRKRIFSLQPHPLFPALVGFFVFGLLSALFSPSLTQSFISLSKFIGCLGFGVVAVSCWGDSHRKFFLWIVLTVGAFQSVLFMIGKICQQSSVLLIPGNPQYCAFWVCAASLIAAGFAFVEGRLLSSEGSKIINYSKAGLWYFLFILLIAGTICSSSRSSIISLFVGLGVFTAFRFGGRGLIAYLIVIGGSFCFLMSDSFVHALLKTDDPLAWKRIDIWRSAINGILEKPLLGWGPGQFSVVYDCHAVPQNSFMVKYGFSTAFAHNEYLQVLSEWGIPAFLFLCWGVIEYGRQFEKKKSFEIGVYAAILSLAFICIFNFPLYVPINGLLLAGLLSLGHFKAHPTELTFNSKKILYISQCVLGFVLIIFMAGNVMLVAGRLSPKVNETLGGVYSVYEENPMIKKADQLLHSSKKPVDQDVEKAENLLYKVLKHSQSNSQAWYNLAHLQSHHKHPPDLQKAIEFLKKACSWHRHQAVWILELSRLFEQVGDYQGALSLAKYALALEPAYNDAGLQIGHLFRMMDSPEKAQKWLKVLLNKQRSAPAQNSFSSYGQIILKRKDHEIRREIELCRRAL